MLLRHVDFTEAFLHEEYDGPTTLYFQLIPEFDGNSRHLGMVDKLRKNIYGSPNSPRLLTEGLRSHLFGMNYSPCRADRNVYYHRTPRVKFMAVAIDEFIVAASSPWIYHRLLTDLSTKYRVTNMGSLRQMIGWTLQRSQKSRNLHISQPRLCDAMIELLKLENESQRTPHIRAEVCYMLRKKRMNRWTYRNNRTAERLKF